MQWVLSSWHPAAKQMAIICDDSVKLRDVFGTMTRVRLALEELRKVRPLEDVAPSERDRSTMLLWVATFEGGVEGILRAVPDSRLVAAAIDYTVLCSDGFSGVPADDPTGRSIAHLCRVWETGLPGPDETPTILLQLRRAIANELIRLPKPFENSYFKARDAFWANAQLDAETTAEHLAAVASVMQNVDDKKQKRTAT